MKLLLKLALSAVACLGQSVMFAQSPVPAVSDAPPYLPTMTFDVASVRESAPADSYRVTGMFAPRSRSLSVTNFDLENLLSMAYGVRRDQIAGAPRWDAKFNIQAKADAAADAQLARLAKDQVWQEQQHMLQGLLAERFQLKVHWEDRDGAIYNLLVAKKGSRLVEAKEGSASPEERAQWGDRPIPRLYQRGNSRTGFDFVAHGCTLSDLTAMLAGQFGTPVVDNTGLTGKYDFILSYHGARQSDRKADDLDPVPTLDVAIQDTLGLKLEPARGPIKFLVVDHIEKPSSN